MKKKSLFLNLFAASLLCIQSVVGQENNKPRVSYPEPLPIEDEVFWGARVIRSATILATSCKDLHRPLNVLIYGQSIVQSQAFTEELETQLKAKFPYADISVTNKCIGGFGGERLIRTAVHDVYPRDPDLIVFHVYGGERHGELEQLFSNIRRYTTAEVLLLNHHLDNNRETINKAPFSYFRYIANKYNLELVDVSTEWVKYLFENEYKKMDLLRDHVHTNRHGAWLMASLVVRHLRFNPLFPSDWINTVQTFFLRTAYDNSGPNPLSFTNEPWRKINDMTVGESPKNTLKLIFNGNRVDIVAGKLNDSIKTGTARILIDGKPLSGQPELLSFTRPNDGPGWPPIMRIGYQKPLLEEEWTLHIDKINADSTIHYFNVKGSRTGTDGAGNSAERFISKSGRVVIEPSDFMLNEIKKTFKESTLPGFEIKWSAVPLYMEIYKHPITSDKNKLYVTTVVKGLRNGVHTIEIIPNGDGAVPIEAIEIHRPPMQ
jgi:hypothetical protein